MNVSCWIPLVAKERVPRTFSCSWASSPLKYFGSTASPLSPSSFSASLSSCSLAPMVQAAAPGVEGGEEEKGRGEEDGGVVGVAVSVRGWVEGGSEGVGMASERD